VSKTGRRKRTALISSTIYQAKTASDHVIHAVTCGIDEIIEIYTDEAERSKRRRVAALLTKKSSELVTITGRLQFDNYLHGLAESQ